MSTAVKIKGQKILERHIKKMENPGKVFNEDIRKTASSSVRRLASTTPRQTGNTARAWTTPKKTRPGLYHVENNVKTPTGQLIVPILDKGRGPITPKRAKRLYIPLSNKGFSKGIGKPIPKGFIYGIDYVLTKKAGPYKGTKFKTKELLRSSRELTKRAIKTIRRVHRGR